MKRKPTSITDMLKTVYAVRHPKLKLHHRIVLNGIALFADAKTGRGAIPTHTFLGYGPNWTAQWTGKSIKYLIELKLIQCVSKATGPGVGSVYRICLEHPAFQEMYPTYKERANGETEHPNYSDNGETPGDEHPNSGNGTVKLETPNGETLEFHLSEALSETTTNTTTNPEACCVLLLQNFTTITGKAPERFSERHTVIKLAAKHGSKTFAGAGERWLAAKPWNDKTTNPFKAFVDGFEGYVTEYRQICVEAANEEQSKVTIADGSRFAEARIALFSNRGDVFDDFISIRPDDERQYVSQMLAARCGNDLPADAPGRSREIIDAYHLYAKQRRETQDAEALADFVANFGDSA